MNDEVKRNLSRMRLRFRNCEEIHHSVKRYAETTSVLNGNKEEWERNSGKKISQQKLADEFGKGQDWISRYLAVASLDNGVKEKLMGISISFEICSKYIIPLKDTQKQLLFLMEIEKKNLSLAQ